MMMDKSQEKEALKALLMSLMNEDSDSKEEVGPYVEERRETSVSPEEVEGELYDDDQEISDDAEDESPESSNDEEEESGEMGLRELVAAFMNEKRDPFSEKKGMPMGGGGKSLEIEMTTEKPVMAAILGKKKKRRK